MGRGWFWAAPIIAEADTLPGGLLGHIYWKENQEDTRAALPKVFSVEYQCFLSDVRKAFFVQMSLGNGTLNKNKVCVEFL